MLPVWLNTRVLFLFLFLLCCAMMGVGYALQYSAGLEPCPLCMTQRAFIVLVGITALIAAVHAPRPLGARIYASLIMLWSGLGGAFSTRHLWLQSLPADQVPACGPSINYILETFPPSEALEILLRGTGDCAKVDWSLLGLSIPGWTLLAFLFIVAVCISILRRR